MENLYQKTGIIISYKDDKEVALYRNKIATRPSNADKIHTIIDGERLDTIAYKYYGNSKYWWVLADVNDVNDTLINPFILTPGTKLIIPSLSNITSS